MDRKKFALAPAPDDNALRQIAALAQKQVTMEGEIAAAETALKELKASYRTLTETELPEAMGAVGLESFTTVDGHEIEVESVITASVSEERRPAVVAWLREHGHGGLVIRQIEIKLPKGEDERGDEIVAALTKLRVSPTDKSTVNTGSLKAFVKEGLAEGLDLPLDLFGVWLGRRSKVSTKD